MANCKLYATPTEERLKLSKDITVAKVDAMRYWSIVSGLWYLTHTRPNIAFAVGEDHWAVVKRLLRYVKGTED